MGSWTCFLAKIDPLDYAMSLKMFRTCARILPILVLSLFAAGCSNSATATLSPGADLTAVKTFYVVHQPRDTHNLHFLIRDRIVKEGYAATAGPEMEESAYRANSIVTYVDRWM